MTSRHASCLLHHLIYNAPNFVFVNICFSLDYTCRLNMQVYSLLPLSPWTQHGSSMRRAGRERKAVEADRGKAWRTSPYWTDGRWASRLPSPVRARLEAEGSSGAELRMENKEQFLCGVVEGKRGRLKTWPPVRSYDWVCVVLFLPRSEMHHRLTQIWALFTCWHAWEWWSVHEPDVGGMREPLWGDAD